MLSNGSVPHKKTEKQDTLCTEIPNKKLVTNDKLMWVFITWRHLHYILCWVFY